MQHFHTGGAQSQSQWEVGVLWAGIFSLCVCMRMSQLHPPKLCTLQGEAQHKAGQSGTGNWAVFSQLHPTRAIPVSSSHCCAHVLHPISLLHLEQTLQSAVCISAAGMREAEGVLQVYQAGVLLRVSSVKPQPLCLDNQVFFLCFCWPLVEARQMKRKNEKRRICVVGRQKGQ